VSPGKFREEVFKEAMKINHCLLPSGVMGYCNKKNSLTLHNLLSVNISPVNFYDIFLLFVECANQWIVSLQQGRTAPIALSLPSPVEARRPLPRSPFDIKS
jgi:hypothetical protein